jgi:hypothetical protein
MYRGEGWLVFEIFDIKLWLTIINFKNSSYLSGNQYWSISKKKETPKLTFYKIMYVHILNFQIFNSQMHFVNLITEHFIYLVSSINVLI